MSKKPPVEKLRPGQYHIPDVSNWHIHRIGQVIMLWSKLEAAMEDTIWMFLNLNEEDGKAITKRLGADAKIQLLRAIGPRHISDMALIATFKKSLILTDELKEGRNFIAHGVWGTLMPDNIPVALSLKPKSEVGQVISETFSQERMEGICEGIRLMLKYFVDLPEQLGRPRQVPLEPDRS